MSRVFVDTSALFALLTVTDSGHRKAARIFDSLRRRQSALLTTSFNLVETYALIDRRLGKEAVRTFRLEVAPLLQIQWVDRDLHERGLDLMLETGRAGISLVDAVSFSYIRAERIDEVFALDRHFAGEGFRMSE